MGNPQFQSTVKAMRILENEHHYLMHLMNEWHAIVLHLQNKRYSQAEANAAFTRLRQLLIEFKAPLKRHTKKEESFFFPLLGKMIGFEQGPLVSIEHEHEEINAYIDHFLHHASEDRERTLTELASVVQDAGEAFEVLTIHFVKEESVLFPMTAQVMKPADQETLFQQLHTLIV